MFFVKFAVADHNFEKILPITHGLKRFDTWVKTGRLQS